MYLRWSLARRGDAILADLKSAHLCSIGRDCRCRDHLSAGEDRRRQKLGLSTVLVARRHLYSLRPPQRRLSRRSESLERMVTARGGWASRRIADYVWAGRRA